MTYTYRLNRKYEIVVVALIMVHNIGYLGKEGGGRVGEGGGGGGWREAGEKVTSFLQYETV